MTLRWEALGAKLVATWPEVSRDVAAAVLRVHRAGGGPRLAETVADRVLASALSDAGVLRHLSFTARDTPGGFSLTTTGRTEVGRTWVKLLEECC